MPVCEIDLRTGGTWHVVYRLANGREHDVRGTYREVDPPNCFVQVQTVDGEENTSTTTFTEENGRTTRSTASRDRALQFAKFGTASSYTRLDAYLASM